jgi:rubrerythrin
MITNIDFANLDLMDALDLAILMEVEAWERYTLFSKQIGYRRPGDAASIFSSMANNEKKHGEQLHHRRLELFGDAPLRVNRDDLFDVEAPESGAPRWNMSPLKAFQLALESEEKAYSFFDEALAHVTHPSVKELFIELRDEESEHAQMLREAIEALPPGSDIDLENEDE